MAELTLTALDGANPLGFLAALGALDASAAASTDARLKWHYEGSWRPVLVGDCRDIDGLIDTLDRDRQTCIADPALALEYEGKKDLKPPPGRFKEFLRGLVSEATPQNRRSVDWASSFATDIAVDNKGNTKPTALHFTAGQQEFLRMVADLVAQVTKDDLREAIVGPWQYSRPLPVMGWDSTSSRDYALRASNPSTDKKLGVPGADWLAIRGLSFLPTMPEGSEVKTTACVGGWKSGGEFLWPMWTVPLSVSLVRTLLRQEVKDLSHAERAGRGIGTVFSSGIKRSDQGGYGSFEPASVI